MCLLRKAILFFFLFFNVILFFIERISSLYRGYQGENLHKLKEKNLFSYMILKNNNFFHIFMFFPHNFKNKGYDINGFQIRILHRKIHRIKEKKTSFFIWP